MRHRGSLSYGRDEWAHAWVLNYTHPYFSIGATTSSWLGPLMGLVGIHLSFTAKKRVSGEKHLQEFRGALLQLGLLVGKIYLYLYFDGDGRGGLK